MVKVVKDFINYLFDIGLVSLKTIKTFIDIFQSNYSKYDEDKISEIEIKNILSQSLIDYISNLNYSSKIILTNDIITKYAENRSNDRIKKAKILYNFYSKMEKRVFLKIFQKLKETNFSLSKDNFTTPLTSLSKAISNHDSINSQKTKINPETSLEKKERENFEQCTFKPVINKNSNYRISNREPDTFNRLYTDYALYKKRKENNINNRESIESKKISFSPNISQNKITNNDSFMKRQADFTKSSKSRRERIRRNADNDELSNCTFQPKLNNNNLIESKVSNYVRGMSSDSNLSKTIYSGRLNSRSNDKKHREVDYKKLENLYNDYKKNNNHRIELQRSIDQEKGVTFKPEINDKYLVNSSFMERNMKLLDDRKVFVENFYKTEEKDKIKISNNEIVERLYSKEINKFIEKNNNNMKNKFEFNKYLRNNDNLNTTGTKAFTFYNKKAEINKNIDNNTVIYHSQNSEDNKDSDANIKIIKDNASDYDMLKKSGSLSSFRSNSMKMLMEKNVRTKDDF